MRLGRPFCPSRAGVVTRRVTQEAGRVACCGLVARWTGGHVLKHRRLLAERKVFTEDLEAKVRRPTNRGKDRLLFIPLWPVEGIRERNVHVFSLSFRSWESLGLCLPSSLSISGSLQVGASAGRRRIRASTSIATSIDMSIEDCRSRLSYLPQTCNLILRPVLPRSTSRSVNNILSNKRSPPGASLEALSRLFPGTLRPAHQAAESPARRTAGVVLTGQVHRHNRLPDGPRT